MQKGKRKKPDPLVLASRGWRPQGPYSAGSSSRGPAYQFFYMEGKRKDGRRRRLSFRYDPRLFAKLESICSHGGKPVEQAAFPKNQGQPPADLPLSTVLLGYDQSYKAVLIREGHILVWGMPQQSGKTTCIEGLLSRWPGNEHKEKKIVAFITKRGEEDVFSSFEKIDPFINTNPDPDFLSLVVESMLVASNRPPTVSRKINLIMAELCHGAKTLKQVLKNASRMRKKVGDKDRLRRDACIALQHYLEHILPNQNQQMGEKEPDFKFSQHIDFNGNNDNVVINISRFSEEVQTLVIGSIAYEVLKHHHDSIIVVPDGWTMFAFNGSSLGRFHVESLIAQGFQNRNYVVIESVIIEEVPLHIRRKMSTILLGYQASGEEAGDEIRALRDLAKHIRQSRSIKSILEKPLLTRLDIQRLKIGEFCAFPSYIEGQSVWRSNKVSTIPP